MNYENCALVLLQKKIVYTDEQLKVLEMLGHSICSGRDPSALRSTTSPVTRWPTNHRTAR